MSVNLMCLDKMCPLYTRCYRAQAIPTHDQKYFKTPYVWKFGCNDYLPMSEVKWRELEDQRRGVEAGGLRQSIPHSSRTPYEATQSDGDPSTIALGLLIAEEVYTNVQSADSSYPEQSWTDSGGVE